MPVTNEVHRVYDVQAYPSTITLVGYRGIENLSATILFPSLRLGAITVFTSSTLAAINRSSSASFER